MLDLYIRAYVFVYSFVVADVGMGGWRNIFICVDVEA